MQHHLASSKRAGLTQDDWQALKSPETSPRFNEKEKAALRFAEKITSTPTNDAGAEADALKKIFNENERVDLTCLVALVNCTNRITDGLGLELDIPAEKI